VLSIVGSFTVDNSFVRPSNLEYRILVKKKLPVNQQNFLALLKLIGFTTQARVAAGPTFLYGFGTLDDVATVADVTATAYLRDDTDPTKMERVGSRVTLDNEGYHSWDISIGFPVTRVEDLSYDEKNGVIQTRKVDKSALLALADLYLRPVDLKNPGAMWAPAIVAGVGLKGKVRDHLFAGLTTNLPPIPGVSFTRSGWYQLFRPYVCVDFINKSVPVTNPAPGAPVSVQKTVRKLAIGLNIPVLSTLQRLAK
jgi:hypothetical protein